MAIQFAQQSPVDSAERRMRKDTSILAVAFCAMNWFSWYTSIHHHWAAIHNHFVAVIFLMLLAFPCISVFARRLLNSQGFTPSAALYTYVLLLLANSMPTTFL